MVVAAPNSETRSHGGGRYSVGTDVGRWFVEIWKTPEGSQKQTEKALEYTIKWRKGECKWEEDESPIANQYTYIGVEISK